MPIKIPGDLPAYDVLSREGVMVMSEEMALHQDIRPLQIALLNLMPKKVQTETQFVRLIGSTALQVEFSLIRMTEHQSRHTAPAHMESFYATFEAAKHRKFDGLIITGAPIELLEYDQVTYWDELRRIFDWTQTNVHRTLGVCWGAQAMLNHFHGVPKHTLAEKSFGCFEHRVRVSTAPVLRGFDDSFIVPVSRWTEIREADLPPGLEVLADSDDSGPCLVDDQAHNALYMFNHLEYETGTLKEEYDRDVAQGRPIHVPVNYYPKDDPARPPRNGWRSHAHLFYGNWLNDIYQSCPYDLNDIGR
ncbi:homoserine O-succinyltransferase [Paroceanicella profunda]|uniref:Homoserine O-acetyltransferase n=1 Tax=Paroceanicella profunda TaxID=2579971 RepID=A0A5B8FI24_9RHOB|nr:homoserine O-succinyltransferase [Paroceanicella profunda]QDL92857.1 homoserine O-succinyltransferase [Paroceanicella profunda]